MNEQVNYSAQTGASVAMRVYQQLLDEIGVAIDANDYDAYSSHIALPHSIQTFDQKSVVTEDSELRDMFDRLYAYINDQKAGTLKRVCLEANYESPTCIKGWHRSWLICKSNKITDSYVSLSTLRLIDGVWRVHDSQYAEDAPSLPAQVTRNLPRAE